MGQVPTPASAVGQAETRTVAVSDIPDNRKTEVATLG